MPSSKKRRNPSLKDYGSKVNKNVHAAETHVGTRRIKNLMAGHEQKLSVLDVVRDLAKTLPPFLGEYTADIGVILGDMVIEGATLDMLHLMPETAPMYRHMLRWIRDKQHPFHKIYYEAKEAKVALYEERIITTATEPEMCDIVTERQVLDKEGNKVDVKEVRTTDNVARSELKVKALTWSLAWMAPRKHSRNALPDGDKPNDQLKNLFEALMAGPAREEDEP